MITVELRDIAVREPGMGVKEQHIVDNKAKYQHGQLELEVHVKEEGTREKSQDTAVDIILREKKERKREQEEEEEKFFGEIGRSINQKKRKRELIKELNLTGTLKRELNRENSCIVFMPDKVEFSSFKKHEVSGIKN